jgi:hypothetical protein
MKLLTAYRRWRTRGFERKNALILVIKYMTL